MATEQTAEEFESWWAGNAGLTVGRLHERGMHGRPCDCGKGDCRGWKMTQLEAMLDSVPMETPYTTEEGRA